MNTSRPDERRSRAAIAAFDLIETEARPHLAAGGNLWTKGSGGYPRRLRQMLRVLDDDHAVTFATRDAMRLEPAERVVEHVIPFKRIIVEVVDPRQADPRSNTHQEPIAEGPAASPEHLLSIFDHLVQKCWVTKEEHDRLNRAGRSLQWDAPDGDVWARYHLADVAAYRSLSRCARTQLSRRAASGIATTDRSARRPRGTPVQGLRLAEDLDAEQHSCVVEVDHDWVAGGLVAHGTSGHG